MLDLDAPTQTSVPHCITSRNAEEFPLVACVCSFNFNKEIKNEKTARQLERPFL
jgi:hypothetical protein